MLKRGKTEVYSFVISFALSQGCYYGLNRTGARIVEILTNVYTLESEINVRSGINIRVGRL